MNELRSYSNESDPEDMMVKKDLIFFFPKMHVSEDKICWNGSCWYVGIVFAFKKQGVGNVTM